MANLGKYVVASGKQWRAFEIFLWLQLQHCFEVKVCIEAEKSASFFALSVMLSHAISREHSSLRRFSYKQFTGLFALRIAFPK